MATNTISQGDTRHTGLRWICARGGTIYAAHKRYKWPGQAAVVVSVLHVMRGATAGPFDLDDRSVPMITAYLFHSGTSEDPATLRANGGKSFQGSILLGMGFTFDDSESNNGASSISEMHDLIANEPRNADCIFPYLGGEELNESPSQSHRRFAINFLDWPLRRTGSLPRWTTAGLNERRRWLSDGVVPTDYEGPVAADYPDLLEIVERKVKGTRGSHSTAQWWHYERLRGDLYNRIRPMARVLVTNAQASAHHSLSFCSPHAVFANSLNVFAFSDGTAFAVLQSSAHEVWARFFGSTLEDRLRYNPTDCFETFPFPRKYELNLGLLNRGQEYYEFRADLCVRNNEGLTKTYNRFHDPGETSPDIIRLRELHAAMDRAVLDAYGWTDLQPTCEFLLDYEEEEDSDEAPRKRKKPWRYRWPDEFRDEVLARLLALNAERAEEERLAGESAGPNKASKSGGKKPRKTKKKSSDKSEQADLIEVRDPI